MNVMRVTGRVNGKYQVKLIPKHNYSAEFKEATMRRRDRFASGTRAADELTRIKQTLQRRFFDKWVSTTCVEGRR